MKKRDGDKKTITHYMRVLHRDIGFLVVGLTIVYALSGIVLVYRETAFLKAPVQVERTLRQQLTVDDISRELRIRGLKETGTDGDVVYFDAGSRLQNGAYNRATGAVSYVEKQLPSFLNRFIGLHKASTSNMFHWFAVVYGAMLLFLAVSALFMYKPKTHQFRRGLVMTGIGLVLTLAILSLV